MGCWNATCAISNLPIFSGEEVYALLLCESPFEPNNFCYATALWQPVGFYFHGSYNDYGALEKCHGEFLQANIEILRTHLVEFDVGENEWHDIEVKKDKFNVELMFEANHENRLLIENCMSHLKDGRPNRKIKIIYIKESIFNGIMKEFNPEEPYSDNGTLRYKTYDEQVLQSCEKYKEKLIGELGMFAEFPHDLRGSEGTYNFPEVRQMFEMAAKHEDKSKFPEICINMMAISKLNYFMDIARHSWVPPSGSGSQNGETEPYEIMIKLMLDEILNIKKRFDE